MHEVAAGIATEYFNATSDKGKAFALVTAGPGLTNIVTAIGGAYLESRELLVIGGQVKREDLSNSPLRQRGIQEINGAKIVEPITNKSVRLDKPINFKQFRKIVEIPKEARKGPIFLELPLDIQGYTLTKLDKKIEINKKIIIRHILGTIYLIATLKFFKNLFQNLSIQNIKSVLAMTLS